MNIGSREIKHIQMTELVFPINMYQLYELFFEFNVLNFTSVHFLSYDIYAQTIPIKYQNSKTYLKYII